MRSVCYRAKMNELDLNTQRIALLRSAIDKVASGNVSEFGRRLGYKDGAFVRQMLGAIRPVSEKTIRAVEALPGLKGWFDQPRPAKVVRAQTRDSAENLPLIFDSEPDKPPHNNSGAAETKTKNVPPDVDYLAEEMKFRPIPVIGRAQGGMPERIWTDGDYPVGATDKYAMVATSDPHAFLTPIVGTSMVPKFNPGDFAFVEPETPVEVEDDVLVRLTTGETLLKRLISRRGGVQLGSYNEPGTMLFAPEEITWMYYVAHYIPARKIKNRM